MIKILTVVGARPQFIKAAAVSRTIKTKFSDKIKEVIVHTGQHYDDNMSKVFFDEMEIPMPDYNLNVGSGSHAVQTSAMMTGIEELLLKEKPRCMIVYGDTNSTFAASVTAAKLRVPVVHIEAGLRSFNKAMPEEINRIVCDNVSTLLFTPTKTGYDNLVKEGICRIFKSVLPSIDNPFVYLSGDVMYDNSLYFSEKADSKTSILKKLKLEPENYILATIHRDYNTDNPDRLTALFKAFDTISKKYNIHFVLPLHPRTSKLLPHKVKKTIYNEVKTNKLLHIIPPVSYLEMIALEKNTKIIMTDSGGVQKEAFFFKKPCVILRSETEWVELVRNGFAIIADADENNIVKAYDNFCNIKSNKFLLYPQIYGNGKTAEFICNEICKYFGDN